MIDPTDGCPECGTVSSTHDDDCDYPNRATCPWCVDPTDDKWSDKLCRAHEAEHDGVTETWLDKRDAAERAEYADAIGDDEMYRYAYPRTR